MDTFEPFSDVRRIVVLRGGGLGDLMFTLPALTALHETYPQARIEVLGTPITSILEGRLGFPVTARPLPPIPGVSAPEGTAADVRETVTGLGDPPIDLAVQLHGGGRFSNPFLLQLRPRHSVGCVTEDATPLERNVPYHFYQHEVTRDLEVVSLAGARTLAREPRLTPRDADLTEATRVLAEHAPDGAGPLVVLHPGASDPRRRWPARNFAALATMLADEGARVAVIGDESEIPLARSVVEGARPARVICLAGRFGLPGLTGLLAVASLVVANDSGPRHLADAVGTATSSVYWCGNVITAGPLTRLHHRIRISWVTTCPVCGVDVTQVGWTAQRCAHNPSFVATVGVDQIHADARALLDGR